MIQSLVATKRSAFLFLSLERLEALRDCKEPLTRTGLSATQRPLEEVARLLGGVDRAAHEKTTPRPVVIVDASAPKKLELSIEVPEDDMAAPPKSFEKRARRDSLHGRRS